MKLFLSYKFSGERIEDVEALLQPAQAALLKQHHDVYINLYDEELRTRADIETFQAKDFIFHVFSKLKEIDVVVVLLASPERSEGMVLEIGYAMALGIPVVVAQQEGITNTYIPTVATAAFRWSDYADLQMKLEAFDFSSLSARTF